MGVLLLFCNRLIVDTADVLIVFWEGKSMSVNTPLIMPKKQQKQVHICQLEKPKYKTATVANR